MEEGDNKNQVGGIWGMASTGKEGWESERAEHIMLRGYRIISDSVVMSSDIRDKENNLLR